MLTESHLASNGAAGKPRAATPSVRMASPASSSLICKISARRASVNGRLAVSCQFTGAAREQHVGAPLVKTRRSCLCASRMDRAHQLALGREGNFPDALEAGVEHFIGEARLARRDYQGALGRIALHRPAAVALLQHRVVGAVPDGKRALEFDPQSTVDPEFRRKNPSARDYLRLPARSPCRSGSRVRSR
jgi:hypothetical protein